MARRVSLPHHLQTRRQGVRAFPEAGCTEEDCSGKVRCERGRTLRIRRGIAGPREIREELGLSVGFHELLSLGRRTFVYCFDEGVTECEFQDVFFLPREVRTGMLVLQSDEVDGVLEMEVEEVIRLFSGKTLPVTGYLFRNLQSGENVSISADDFVPCLDNYYLKLLLLARRYFASEHEPLII
jgi:hypothetical protein